MPHPKRIHHPLGSPAPRLRRKRPEATDRSAARDRRHARSLVTLTPAEQLRAGRLTRRVTQLMVGLTVYGVSMAMLIRSALGLDPWDVLHVGLAPHLELSIGVTTIVVGAVVLLGWIPLRQWPGLGTVLNTIWIGLATDAGLALIPVTDHLGGRWALLIGGIVANGLAGALYIGSQLGPGPRDGLMTGLHHRTGLSIRLVRTCLEFTVLVLGWWLGGTVGIGTVLYALGIGPLLHAFLPRCIVPVMRDVDQQPVRDDLGASAQ